MLTDVQRRLAVCVCVLASGALSAVASAQAPPPPRPGASVFSVFTHATPSGFERSSIIRTEDGWLIRATNQITAPIALETRLFELTYDAEWRPQRLSMAGTRDGELFSVESTFGGDIVTNEVRTGTAVSTSEERIDATSVVLPNFLFAAYEALAVRLSVSRPGTQIPVYVAPHGYITARVNSIDTQHLETAAGALRARIYRVTFDNPNDPIDAEIWVDEGRRLMRVSLPSASIDVAREDIISVSTRLTGDPHPGDESVRVAAAGFSLAATLTTPTPADAAPPADGRWPAVLLVPGSGPVDRDVTVSGVSIFRQLAHALVDSGFMVMRYDKRGVGQSGGRAESAALDDYAEDVRELVRYLERRDDVDRDRVVVVGHSEGGWVGLLAARRERKIKALALIATSGISGDGLILEQQQTALDELAESDAVRQEKVELQRRIHRAVLDEDEGDWEGIPPAVRTQADTPWFRSVLAFDPADIVRRVRQPILVVQGELDQQVLAYHADRLESLAQARTRDESTVEVTTLDGINHLLVPATTGSVSEYASLPDHQITPRVAEALVDWIGRTLPE